MTAAAGLTPRMRDCLAAIESYIAANRCSPSIEDLRTSLGLSSKGRVSVIVQALQERGYVRFKPRLSRTIVLTPKTPGELPPHIDAKLRRYCASTGDDPADVMIDAVTLFLDQMESDPPPVEAFRGAQR
ncbi:LexA family protein [Rhodopseudomonas sp.]|uniref:LexA family protein n=1 Tax=Rhodopseudomonas sp. TaxID=1078 RepID=UPI003B3BA9E4